MTDKDKAFINNPTPTIQEEVLTLRIENAELKAKLKGFENGDVAWQGDMDKTIKQNLELKEQNELLTKRITELQADKGRLIDEVEEMKAHCKAIDEVNEKMKCCENCKYNEIYDGEEFCNNEKGVCKYYSKTFKEDNWELAE